MERVRRWLATPARGRLDLVIAVAWAGVVVGVVGIWRTRDPGSCMIGLDAELWAAAARDLSHFDPLFAIRYSRQPAYVVASAVVSWFTGDVVQATMLVSIASVATLASALYLLAGRWFGRGAGMVAAAGAPLHMPLLRLAIHSAADALFLPVFFACSLVIALSWDRRGWRWPLLTGVILGLSALCKPPALLLVPLAAFLVWLRPDTDRRRWLRPLAVVVGTAAIALTWSVIESTWWEVGGSLHGPLRLVTLDAVQVPDAGQRDGLVQKFQSLGLSTEGLQDGPIRRLQTVVFTNLGRQAAYVWGAARVLILAPFGLLAVWLVPSQRERAPRLTVLAACGATALFALPVFWDERHMAPFVAPTSLAGAALVGIALRQAATSRAWAIGSIVSALVVLAPLPSDLQATFQDWADLRTVRYCDDGSRLAGRWLAENMPPDRHNRLSQVNPTLAVYAGVDPSIRNPPNPFFRPDEVFIETGDEVFWVVISPGLEDNPYYGDLTPFAYYRRHGMSPAAQLVATLEVPPTAGRPVLPLEIYMVDWPEASQQGLVHATTTRSDHFQVRNAWTVYSTLRRPSPGSPMAQAYNVQLRSLGWR